MEQIARGVSLGRGAMRAVGIIQYHTPKSEVGKLECELEGSKLIAAEKEEARIAATTRADRVSAYCCYTCQAVLTVAMYVKLRMSPGQL